MTDNSLVEKKGKFSLIELLMVINCALNASVYIQWYISINKVVNVLMD